MQENTTYTAGLYLRLSKDDEQQGESVSIGTQRSILSDYCKANHYSIYAHPEICPKTHRVYHDMLYPYVLQQVQAFARSMKRRKVNSSINKYASIDELTPEILDTVIDRIEIGHVRKKSKPGNVIQIYWKLK